MSDNKPRIHLKEMSDEICIYVNKYRDTNECLQEFVSKSKPEKDDSKFYNIKCYVPKTKSIPISELEKLIEKWGKEKKGIINGEETKWLTEDQKMINHVSVITIDACVLDLQNLIDKGEN